ncbi:unnamed protein product, partial [Phaeothamnion confervicola]
ADEARGTTSAAAAALMAAIAARRGSKKGAKRPSRRVIVRHLTRLQLLGAPAAGVAPENSLAATAAATTGPEARRLIVDADDWRVVVQLAALPSSFCNGAIAAAT